MVKANHITFLNAWHPATVKPLDSICYGSGIKCIDQRRERIYRDE